MNVYAWIVLVALLGEFILSLVASVLNVRAMSPVVPDEFRGAYDAEAYARSQAYTRAQSRFGVVRGTTGLAALLLFWQLGGFGWLDEQCRAFGLGPVPTGLLFVGTLVVGSTVLGLPFRIYGTFVIEERFGFNRTTWPTFGLDLVKGLVLGAVLGGTLLTALLWLFESAGPVAWVACWAVTTAFTLAAQFLAPTWIMPLFNTFTPLEQPALKEALVDYARSTDFPLDDVFVVDGSRRSAKANAFFTGFGSHKRIGLFDTLIQRHTTEELVAVVAHEVGHYKRAHMLKSLALGVAHTGVLFWLLAQFLERPGLFSAFAVAEPSVYAGMVFFGLLFTPIDLVLSVVVSVVSRRHEFEADAFAAATTGGVEPMIAALKKLSTDSLSNLTPHPLHVLLHDSHPPVLRRIAALRALSSA